MGDLDADRSQTMSQDNLSQPAPVISPGRRFDLDWVRIAAFGLLILYHVGMLYVPWEFHIKSAHRITALEPWMRLVNPWRLALLFLVSGLATRFMLDKYPPGRLLRTRSVRLLLPLLFGMLVVVPPQAYLQVLDSAGFDGGFLAFYRAHYFAFGPQFCDPGPCLLLPTWNHLWFVAYLWLYTIALGAAVAAAPAWARRIETALAPLDSGAMVLLVPAALLTGYRLLLLPSFPSTHALVGDWYNHALYATVFLFGFMVARAEGVWRAIDGVRWWALALAVALIAVDLVVRLGDFGEPSLRFGIYRGASYGCYQWFCIVALLGFAGRGLNRDSAARRYLTDAMFPYYIMHQTAIILIAHQLGAAGLPASVEAAIVIAGTVAACAATYELVRRVRLLRPLFGLRLDLSGNGGHPGRAAPIPSTGSQSVAETKLREPEGRNVGSCLS